MMTNSLCRFMPRAQMTRATWNTTLTNLYKLNSSLAERCCSTFPILTVNNNKSVTRPDQKLGTKNWSESLCCGDSNLLMYQPVRHAGHSHWQNIRHTKGAVDAQRQKDNIRIRQKIRFAIKTGGGTDPKLNRDLARAIEDGKSCNMPLAAMMETIKKVTDSREEGSDMIFEAMNILSNFFVMIECYTDRPNHVRIQLKGILKRAGGKLMEPGRAASMFDHKGVLYVLPTEAYQLDVDQATEQAIEAGAEEVIQTTDSNGNDCLKFFCEPKELHQVKKVLEELQVPVDDARMEYIPHTFVKINQAQAEMAQKMVTVLEEYEDVVRVYDNIEMDTPSS